MRIKLKKGCVVVPDDSILVNRSKKRTPSHFCALWDGEEKLKPVIVLLDTPADLSTDDKEDGFIDELISDMPDYMAARKEEKPFPHQRFYLYQYGAPSREQL